MRHFQYYIFSLVTFFVICAGCARVSSPSAAPSLKKKTEEQVFAIKSVNVIPMTQDGAMLTNVTVIIRNGQITAFDQRVPAHAKVIDGSGKWLIPGLIDMHVHIPADLHFGPGLPTQGATIFFNTQDVMTPYIANGVTTIFDLNSRAEHFAQRNEIAKGTVIGPRMALAALINGGNGSGRIVNTAEDGRQAVRSAKLRGMSLSRCIPTLI